MPSCVVLNCVQRTDGSGCKVPLFCFPHRDVKRKRQWVRNIKRRNWKPTPNSRICALHFTPDCFYARSGRRKLHSNAVPTIFAFSRWTPIYNMHRKLSDIVYLDHPYHNTTGPSTSGEVTSTEVNSEVNSEVNTEVNSEVNTVVNTVVKTEVDPVVITEVYSEVNTKVNTDPLSRSTATQTTPQEHVRPSSSSSASADHCPAPNTQIDACHKLHCKIQMVGRKLDNCRKNLKMEKQKTRRLNKKICWLTDVVGELQQEIREMTQNTPITAPAYRRKRQSGSTGTSGSTVTSASKVKSGSKVTSVSTVTSANKVKQVRQKDKGVVPMDG